MSLNTQSLPYSKNLNFTREKETKNYFVRKKKQQTNKIIILLILTLNKKGKSLPNFLRTLSPNNSGLLAKYSFKDCLEESKTEGQDG